jgi:exosortase
MTRRDFIALTGLFCIAAYIWIRNMMWIQSPDTTVLCLVCLALFVHLGRPWNLSHPKDRNQGVATFIGGLHCFLIGAALDVTLLMAIGWVMLFWSWLSPLIAVENRPRVAQLCSLLVLAFPWFVTDGWFLSWAFRYSGAWASECLLLIIGTDVVRIGTQLTVPGTVFDVEEGCNGLGVLQALLTIGMCVAWQRLGGRKRFWFNLPVLLICAWFANVLRISVIGLAAVHGGVEFANGAFHTIGGLIVLVSMFLFTIAALELQRKVKFKRWKIQPITA